MDSVACFIPVKSRSTRVPGKNKRLLNGKALFEYIIDAAVASSAFDEIYVDTDCEVVAEYAISKKCQVIERDPELSKDTANGNDLINYWHENFPHFNLYFQLFATSPFTKPETIKSCVDLLKKDNSHDSVLTVHEECGWYWFEGLPVNYDPKVLPRSQDAKKVFSETTALYGITKLSLEKNRSRIGESPYFFFVDDTEAVDIDSEFDFHYASILAKAL